METNRLKSTADQKPSTVKPGTNLAANKTKIALITIVNNPKVKIFMGKVRRISKGLRKILKIPKTRATQSADQKLATRTPGKIYEAKITTRALASQLIRIPMNLNIADFRTYSKAPD